MRPLALDLFCGAGGASMGLYRAGYEVIGVDVVKQPRYPFRFIQADALKPPVDLARFDLVWASPPCQLFSIANAANRAKGTAKAKNLIPQTRALLAGIAAATVIENVPHAPIRPDLKLFGMMFGLRLRRERWFELSFLALGPGLRHLRRGAVARGEIVTVVEPGRLARERGDPPISKAIWADAMCIDWMSREELTQAIPPAYSEFIGRAALAQLGNRRAA